MDDSTLVLPAMVRPALATANRRLLEAIETPPDTGIERTLDRCAAVLWHYADETDREPDPARLRQLHHELSRLESNVEGRKQLLVRDARTAVRRASSGLESV